jgi:signal transduction histidine kinase
MNIEASTARAPFGDDDTARIGRVFAEKVRLLYRGTLVVPANAVAAGIVAFGLWRSVATERLTLWVVATFAVVILRLWLQRRYLAAVDRDERAGRWARLYTGCAALSGSLWGILAAALPSFSSQADVALVTFVIAGMSAGGLSSLSPYLPAFLAYVLPILLPFAGTSLSGGDAEHIAYAALALAYLSFITIAALTFNRAIDRTLRLRIENEQLSRSLASAHADIGVARQDKWHTLAQLSHELRTPLTAILGFSEAMRGRLFGELGNDRYRDYAEHIHRSGEHLLALADEILELSRSEVAASELRESEVDVARLVEDCAALLRPEAEGHGLVLRHEAAASLPHLRADRTKLRQILLNLLSNAIKFTPAGEVVITAACDAEGRVCVTVRDTGIGMAPEDIPRAMAPFVRLASALTDGTQGAGLGLPLCKRLAELHGAEFVIRSALGAGTACTVVFPRERNLQPS